MKNWKFSIFHPLSEGYLPKIFSPIERAQINYPMIFWAKAHYFPVQNDVLRAKNRVWKFFGKIVRVRNSNPGSRFENPSTYTFDQKNFFFATFPHSMGHISAQNNPIREFDISLERPENGLNLISWQVLTKIKIQVSTLQNVPKFHRKFFPIFTLCNGKFF